MKFKNIAKICALVMATGITLSKETHEINYIEQYRNMKIENSQDSFNTNLIIKLIKENNNIGQLEKDFLCSFKDYFNDRSKYFNMNTIIPALKNLKIIYTGQTNKLTLASFNRETYEIKINNYKKFDESEEIKDLLFHEFIHSLSIYEGISRTDIYIYEGITEQENINYNDVEKPNYKLLRDYIAELRKIVGEDILLNYFYSGNSNIIIDELSHIKKGRREAQLLLDSICNHYYYGQKFYAKGEEEAEIQAEKLINSYKKVLTKTK